MKKLVCLLIVCSIAGISYASQGGGGKKAPANLDNPSIAKSKKAMNRQDREFASKKYSSVVNGNRITRAQKRAAKKQAAQKE